MQSKDLYIKQKLAEKGKFDYSEEEFNKLKKEFIDNLFIYKDKEEAFEEAYKKVFGGRNNA